MQNRHTDNGETMLVAITIPAGFTETEVVPLKDVPSFSKRGFRLCALVEFDRVLPAAEATGDTSATPTRVVKDVLAVMAVRPTDADSAIQKTVADAMDLSQKLQTSLQLSRSDVTEQTARADRADKRAADAEARVAALEAELTRLRALPEAVAAPKPLDA